jgi:hypothetical protein
MQQPVLMRAVEKLAQAGVQAGFSVEDLIRILNAGVSVENLLDIIELNLQCRERAGRSSPWIM